MQVSQRQLTSQFCGASRLIARLRAQLSQYSQESAGIQIIACALMSDVLRIFSTAAS